LDPKGFFWDISRELLNAYIFRTLAEVREKAEEWMFDYNNHRPHDSLNNKAPADLLMELATKFYF
jgi:putative transposase